MKLKALALSLLLITASLIAPRGVCAQASSQTTRGTWADVMSVAPGKELLVQLINGTTEKGKLSVASETKLTLTRRQQNIEIDRADVLRVYRIGGRQMGRRALIGMGIGAGAGAIIGGVTFKGETENGEEFLPALVFGIVGGGLGALAGVIAGSSKKRTLIYEARTASK